VASATELIANSFYSGEVLYRIYGRKARVAQLGVDTSIFCPRGERRRNIVLSVGALHPIKAHDFGIRCIGAIPLNERPELIIASPKGTQARAEKCFLENLARELGVPLQFMIVTDDQILAGLYSGAIATLCCSHLEPFGLTSLESMACGTPVLAVAEGGMRETILHEKTGFLLPWQEKLFAASLQKLINNRKLAETMGSCGVKWVREQWSWRRCADTVGAVIQGVYGGHSVDAIKGA
jgi:glycosyltransferase involved in cell wall biosynthesis